MSRGKYIVIEGNDGTGKSTQVELLSAYLNQQGIETFVAHEPGGTPIADEIRTIIKNGELDRSPETNLLLFTAARHEIWKVARQKLEQGAWVLSARNYFSTIAFQGYGEGLSIELIKKTTRQFTDDLYMTPDRTILLTLQKEEREKRIHQRGELAVKDTFESKNSEFQLRLEQGYKTLANKHELITIDGSASVQSIHKRIIETLDFASPHTTTS